jgi:hypothetical protein
VKREDEVFRSADPENRRSSGGNRSTSRARRSDFDRAGASGRSGYGSDSVRPYLRAQLKMKELLATPFPPPDEEKDKPDAG